MKGALMGVSIVMILFLSLIVGCGVQEEPQASTDESDTYIESSTEYNGFTVYKLVVKEKTDCKYLITKNNNNGQMTTTQMLNALGKPVCE